MNAQFTQHYQKRIFHSIILHQVQGGDSLKGTGACPVEPRGMAQQEQHWNENMSHGASSVVNQR